jgi:hypothetical protein
VGANKEDSSSAGVDGDQTNNGAPGSGAVYVLRRTEQGWQQESYLKASNPGGYPKSPVQSADSFGLSLALDRDTLVVGAPGEDSGASGVNGNQDDNSVLDSGAVYVFRRRDGTWTQEAYIKASNADRFDRFGSSLALSGDTLIVGAYGEASGVGGDQSDNSRPSSGAVYVFRRCGSTWTQEAYLKASSPDEDDRFGSSVALSGDRLVVGAYGEDSAAGGVEGDQQDNTSSRSGAVYVFRGTASGWSQEAYLKPSQPLADAAFGARVAIEGNTLAASAPGYSGATGGVFVFSRTQGGWTEAAHLTGENAREGDSFGSSLALADGLLAVGAPRDDSATSGVDGEPSEALVRTSGAAYVFARGVRDWEQVHYIKAAEPQNDALFGAGVVLSGTDLVVAAPSEYVIGDGEFLLHAGAVHAYR